MRGAVIPAKPGFQASQSSTKAKTAPWRKRSKGGRVRPNAPSSYSAPEARKESETVTLPMLAQGQTRDPGCVIGMGALVGLAYRQGDIAGVWNWLLRRYAENPEDAAALMDMSIILQTAGHKEKGLELQRQALSLRRCFHRVHGCGKGFKALVFMAEGDFMANTPVDFLMDGSDAILSMVYVDAETRDLGDLPEHDAAFVAIGESEENGAVLENLDRLLRDWPRPVMNGAPKSILAMTRDGVAAMFADGPSLYAPPTVRLNRQSLERLCRGEIALAALLPGVDFPLIARPFGTHAGEGMEKIDSLGDLEAYLRGRTEQRFYLAQFVDYASDDGLFRKQRIAIVDGRAYPGHLAISRHWMVHYLNSGMLENEAWRDEEAAWMRDFDHAFSVRHAAAFEALAQKIGLDYFVIDCAETRDGRLLLFEAQTAMILHAMDPVDVFPYKQPAMRRLFAAFQAALQRRASMIETARAPQQP
jgi:hypothetical protein